MNIPFKPLRDVFSIIFSLLFALFPDAAHDTVKKFPPTVKTFRTSWEKSLNPILRLITYPDRGNLRMRKDIYIPRPAVPSPSSFPAPLSQKIAARFYYAGTQQELANASTLILDIPGGGFVTMEPRNHDDYLSELARTTKSPIVSINYGKSPEFPYPWALEECFDAFRTLVEGNGECLGIKGLKKKKSHKQLKVILMGDSAGANIAVGVVMKIIEYHHAPNLPLPVSLVLMYPCLSFEMACWMPTDHMDLLEKDDNSGVLRVVRSKTDIRLSEPLAHREAPSRINVLTNQVDEGPSWYRTRQDPEEKVIHSHLSMTSRMSFFSDRILGPEMLRSMALMYLANSPLNPNVTRDYYLSPLIAPEMILAQFPKTYIMCGEKDPLVDDSVVFAARLRNAKTRANQEWERLKQEKDYLGSDGSMSPVYRDHLFSQSPESQIKVKILPGMSHGFLQFQTILPEGKQAVKVLDKWIHEGFNRDDEVKADDTVTSRVLGSMMETDENQILLRRRGSMVNRLVYL